MLVAAVGVAACGSDTAPYVVELSTPEETPLALPLIPTHPPDGDPTYGVTAEPQHGTLEGTFPTAVYTPAEDYNGEDEIVIRVEDGAGTVELTLAITVTPTNDAPVAGPDVVTVTEDTLQMIPSTMLLANDTDVDGDALSIIGVHSVRFGAAVLDGDMVKFTPAADFNGSATLLYTLSDGETTAPGVLTLSVGAVNDPPVAGDDYFNTDEDTPLTIESFQLLGNDTDVELDNLTVTAVSNPQNGSVTLESDVITFTPASSFIGDATFDYSVTDGTSTVTGKVIVTVGTATATVNITVTN